MRAARTLLRLAGWTTLVAGLVGAWRQRREVRAVHRGELSRVTAATSAAPPPGTGAVARALGEWVPRPPVSPAGRAAAACWAGPATVVGLLVGALSGGRPRWDDEHRCLVFEGVHGPVARMLRAVGAGANAIGQVVVSTYDPVPPVLLAHEATHVRQAERLGPALLPLYLWSGARYGYRHNPFERAARHGARTWRDRTGR